LDFHYEDIIERWIDEHAVQLALRDQLHLANGDRCDQVEAL
jgi:hypothetical protein